MGGCGGQSNTQKVELKNQGSIYDEVDLPPNIEVYQKQVDQINGLKSGLGKLPKIPDESLNQLTEFLNLVDQMNKLIIVPQNPAKPPLKEEEKNSIQDRLVFKMAANHFPKISSQISQLIIDDHFNESYPILSQNFEDEQQQCQKTIDEINDYIKQQKSDTKTQ